MEIKRESYFQLVGKYAFSRTNFAQQNSPLLFVLPQSGRMEIKMKKAIKTISAIFAAIMLLAVFSACSKSDIPDGYQLIACEGDEFRLYVPASWIKNTSGGVTSAYYSMQNNSSVSVYTPSDAVGLTVEEYWNVCDKNNSNLDSYSYAGSETTTLGGRPAYKYVYTANVPVTDTVSGEKSLSAYKFMQIMAENNGKIYVLIYSAPAESYDANLAVLEGSGDDAGIRGYFKFAEPYKDEDAKKEYSDKVTAPDGMKLASTDERAYRFFVPDSWVVNQRTDATAAYASDTDRSNVNVQMYMTSSPSETVELYFENMEKSYQDIFSEYSRISSENIELSGFKGCKYIFKATSGEQHYKIMQAITRKGDMFYCITYTALEENYEKHLPDVEKMISSFDIR